MITYTEIHIDHLVFNLQRNLKWNCMTLPQLALICVFIMQFKATKQELEISAGLDWNPLLVDKSNQESGTANSSYAYWAVERGEYCTWPPTISGAHTQTLLYIFNSGRWGQPLQSDNHSLLNSTRVLLTHSYTGHPRLKESLHLKLALTLWSLLS